MWRGEVRGTNISSNIAIVSKVRISEGFGGAADIWVSVEPEASVQMS